MIVVVGGQARKSGKTTVMCDVIGATPEARWVAVKVSPHSHDTGKAGHRPDTHRYLDAGAAAAHLIGKADRMPEAQNLIVESNSVLAHVHPDLVVFVRSEDPNAEWKPSARALQMAADISVTARATADLVVRVRELLARQL
jgi:molybdopterin-guanine dinucleotide biosynthesis protein